jgi:hypothetical protein
MARFYDVGVIGTPVCQVYICDVPEIDEIDDLLQQHPQPIAEEDSAEYKAGFQAGEDGEPCCAKSLDWQHGWADAQE